MVVTLIGEKMAREGVMFIFTGPTNDCRDCKLKNVCLSLDVGGRYRVTAVRDKHHECNLNEDGVRIIEAQKVPFLAAVESKAAIAGSIVTINIGNCKMRSCAHYYLCNPVGVKKDEKKKVLSIGEDLECKIGMSLKQATVE